MSGRSSKAFAGGAPFGSAGFSSRPGLKLKRILCAFAALSAASCASPGIIRQSPNYAAQARLQFEDEVSPRVLVVAHRACWVEGAPENSLAAISLCASLGVDMVEIDVARTRDGELVLMHDATLDRTTTGQGAVSSFTLAELKALRLRAGAGGPEAETTNEPIPTLRDALLLARGRVLLNLDLKADVYKDSLSVVRALGLESQVLTKLNVMPGDPQLAAVGNRGKAMFMPIIRQCDEAPRPCALRFSEVVQPFQRYDPVAFEVVFTDPAYLAEGVAAVRRAGGRIWVNTLTPNLAANMTDQGALSEPAANWGRAVDMGANIIQTDRPKRLISYLEGRNLR